MKKFFFITTCFLLILFAFYYTYDFKEKEIQENTKEDIKEDIKEEEPAFVDNNPIILGLYKYYGSSKDRELIKEYNSKWEYHKDISSFEVYYTNEENITGNNQIKTFDLYKNNYENIDDYRIGYIISFTTNDIEINKTILSPKDTEEFYDYLEIYLYDDYHRTGGWYSHTTQNEFNENTLLTSIKLTAGKKVNEINSSITVTAFTYIKDDLDENNNYIGNSKYQIVVNNN